MDKINQKKPHVVFIPFPAQSHIKCMLKLAKLLHHKGIQITFVNTDSNQNRLLSSAGIQDLDDAVGFRFRTVPDGGQGSTQNIHQVTGYLATNFLGSFLELVAQLETPITCIISDGFMTFAKTPFAAEKLGVPIILFWTLAACGFMGFYQAKVLMDKGIVPLKDESYLTNGYLDTIIDIPGMKDIRLRDLPEHVLGVKPKAMFLKFMAEAAREADKHSHMIIHTFDELETNIIKQLKSMFLNVYTIGPLQLLLKPMTKIETNVSDFKGYSLWTEEPECIKWLDSKEPNSVVYVNFGSLAVMCLEDLLEFGWGLVNSNHYFLWIIRTDLVDGDPTVNKNAVPENSLSPTYQENNKKSLVLGPELEEMVKKRGFIGTWCSQEEVLNHPSVGGFLTHGGWGSVIEGLSAGVPMLCWPYSGDQRTNCRQMCKDWEVGMEIEKSVKSVEVEKLVRMLMGGEEGEKLRKKAMKWKKKAEIATTYNGSSSMSFEKLVDEISMLSRN